MNRSTRSKAAKTAGTSSTRGVTPVFWMGTTQWQIFRDNTPDEAATILQNVKSKGFSFIQAMLFGPARCDSEHWPARVLDARRMGRRSVDCGIARRRMSPPDVASYGVHLQATLVLIQGRCSRPVFEQPIRLTSRVFHRPHPQSVVGRLSIVDKRKYI